MKTPDSIPLTLSRPQYDQAMKENAPLIKKALAECKKGRGWGNGAYQWTHNGLILKALTPETHEAIMLLVLSFPV